MYQTTPETAFRSFLYGAAATLLGFDVFFLVKALFTTNFVPIVPILAGILTAGGLLLIVYAEAKAREEHRRDHRRISRVAHQLESPLATLEKDLAALRAGSKALPSEARLKLTQMETKSQVLLANIRDVFLLLQASEEPIAREVRRYDVCTVLADVLADHEQQAGARNVELVHTYKCKTAPVRVDVSLLKVALHHLLENAILYSPKPGLVNIALSKDTKTVSIVVQDRGIGLTEADEQIVWQPFARGARAAEHDPDGIGVGLTLSRLIAREFGGEVTYQKTSPGTGSEFTLTLPLATGATRGN